MARTLQTARLSTGGKAPRKQIIHKKAIRTTNKSKRTKQTARKSTGGSLPNNDTDTSMQNDSKTIVVTRAELIPRLPKRRAKSPPESTSLSLRRSARIRRKKGEEVDEDTTASPSTTPAAEHSNQPFYPNNERPRPFLPFARFDNDPELLSSIQDLNVPLLANAVWQPYSDGESQLRGGFGYVERASWNKQEVAVKFLKSSQTVSGTIRGKKVRTSWINVHLLTRLTC
ncbi:hypothetical protein FRC12_005360 [Ceratobasidium sp. 428]|nr:hypothetical protein FRC12_005360 [Ceratobasidium sp. 428]